MRARVAALRARSSASEARRNASVQSTSVFLTILMTPTVGRPSRMPPRCHSITPASSSHWRQRDVWRKEYPARLASWRAVVWTVADRSARVSCASRARVSRIARDAANSLPLSGPHPIRDRAARIDVNDMPALRMPRALGAGTVAGQAAASSARGPLIAARAAAIKSARSSSVHDSAAALMTGFPPCTGSPQSHSNATA